MQNLTTKYFTTQLTIYIRKNYQLSFTYFAHKNCKSSHTILLLISQWRVFINLILQLYNFSYNFHCKTLQDLFG